MQYASKKIQEVKGQTDFYIDQGVKKCRLCGREVKKIENKACAPKNKSILKIIGIGFLVLSICVASMWTALYYRNISPTIAPEAKISPKNPDPVIQKEPCILNPTIHDVEHSGYCTSGEIYNAFKVHRKLVEEHEKSMKSQAKEDANQAFESIEKVRMDEKEENDEFIRKMDSPTEQEKEEFQRKIDEKMDLKFNGWSGYIPRNSAVKPERAECPIDARNIDSYKGLELPILLNNPDVNPYCKAHAEVILDIPKDSNDTEIKRKYRTLALEFHPDKYKGHNGDNIFSIIRTSYETLTIL